METKTRSEQIVTKFSSHSTEVRTVLFLVWVRPCQQLCLTMIIILDICSDDQAKHQNTKTQLMSIEDPLFSLISICDPMLTS